jgi:hypothetical protein
MAVGFRVIESPEVAGENGSGFVLRRAEQGPEAHGNLNSPLHSPGIGFGLYTDKSRFLERTGFHHPI